MGNAAWVCFSCRIAVRRSTLHDDDAPCPECGSTCTGIGYRIPVLPKRDLKAWAALEDDLRLRAREAAEDREVSRVRSRHEIERQVRELESRPANEGRRREIARLRRLLGEG